MKKLTTKILCALMLLSLISCEVQSNNDSDSNEAGIQSASTAPKCTEAFLMVWDDLEDGYKLLKEVTEANNLSEVQRIKSEVKDYCNQYVYSLLANTKPGDVCQTVETDENGNIEETEFEMYGLVDFCNNPRVVE